MARSAVYNILQEISIFKRLRPVKTLFSIRQYNRGGKLRTLFLALNVILFFCMTNYFADVARILATRQQALRLVKRQWRGGAKRDTLAAKYHCQVLLSHSPLLSLAVITSKPYASSLSSRLVERPSFSPAWPGTSSPTLTVTITTGPATSPPAPFGRTWTVYSRVISGRLID